MSDVVKKLKEEFPKADARIAATMGQNITPLQKIQFLDQPSYSIFAKREDQMPHAFSFKARGGINGMQAAVERNPNLKGVVTASAGNHAQGIAMAARQLGLAATIYMPETTPNAKITAVKRLGGDHASIELYGASYTDAFEKASSYVETTGIPMIHPFDNIDVIAGQSTIAQEIIAQNTGQKAFDYAFLQIGGGGMAAGVAMRLKDAYPKIKIIGVECVGQNSMELSIEAGRPITMNRVDTFCDGTAVKRPGDITFELCRDYIDDFITVTNNEVSAAVQTCHSLLRALPETSGAIGAAGIAKYLRETPHLLEGKNIVSVLSGANIDFNRLGVIAESAAVGAYKKQYIRVELDEKKGGLLALLDNHMLDINVTDFLYGKNNAKFAHPVIGLGASPKRFLELEKSLTDAGIPFQNVTGDEDIIASNIPYSPKLVEKSDFYNIAFKETTGSLRNLLNSIQDIADVSYFNYRYSGQSTGQALMGFNTTQQDELVKRLVNNSVSVQKTSDRAVSHIKNITTQPS